MSESNLILNITVNPPVVSIFGPVKEQTIKKLNEVLPNSCSTTNTGSIAFALERKEEPPHWHGELTSHFASSDLSTPQLIVNCLDAIEEEGLWTLCGSTATTHDNDKCTQRFFFARKQF